MQREIRLLKAQHPDLIGVSGMALGVDQWFAVVCLENDVPFDAFIPFVGQEQKWPAASQQKYRDLLACARNTVVCSGGGYSPAAMHTRNADMVFNGDYGIGVWNGDRSGGTFDCWKKLLESGKPFTRIDPKEISITRMNGTRGACIIPDNPIIWTDDYGVPYVACDGFWKGYPLDEVGDKDPLYLSSLKQRCEASQLAPAAFVISETMRNLGGFPP